MADQAQNLRNLVQNKRASTTPTRIITVTSGKGGVGKSMISLNLAIELSRRGCRTLLIDADFGLANIDIMLGVNTQYDLSHVMSGEKTIHEVINEGHCGVSFISGGSGVDNLMNLNDAQTGDLIRNFLQLEDIADIIIFDTGAGLNDNIMRMVAASTETLLVTTPEPTAVLDAYAVVKTIARFSRVPEIGLVVNRAENVREALDTIDSFTRIVEKYTGLEIAKKNYVLSDYSVVNAVKTQTPIIIGAPQSIAAQNIAAIADKYVRQTVPQEQTHSGIASFFQRLLSRS